MDISIIGSGNVAWHLAKFFRQHGHRIVHIYNRTASHAQVLADAVSAQFSTSFENLATVPIDLLVIAVNDDAIEEVVRQITPAWETIVVHTSGATAIDILGDFEKHGVIYPPQSISRHIDSQLADIPFAIEGCTEEVANILLRSMQAMAPKSFLCNSEQRLALHVASVFVNNFPNALYQIAYEILEQRGLDFELLRPLILETAKKVQYRIPYTVQTGPASRNDQRTMDTHLRFLSDNDDLTEIYQQLTSVILGNSCKQQLNYTQDNK